MSGYIRLHRKFADSACMSDDWLCRLWIYLILRANWKPGWFRGEPIGVGQFAFSYRDLASRMGVSENRLRRGFAKLESFGQITVKSGARFSVITICNWGTYQNDTEKSGALTDTLTEARVEARVEDDRRKKEPKQENTKLVPSPDGGETGALSEWEFPVVGGKEKVWTLPQALLDEYVAAYPALDIPQHLRAARAWLVTNTSRRKTARGMAKFLNGWLERNQNRGRNGKSVEALSGRGDVIGKVEQRREQLRGVLVKRHGVRDGAEQERLIDEQLRKEGLLK